VELTVKSQPDFQIRWNAWTQIFPVLSPKTQFP